MAASTTPQSPTGIIAGRILQLARRSAGLSQEAHAERLDVSLDTLQGWESGHAAAAATASRPWSTSATNSPPAAPTIR